MDQFISILFENNHSNYHICKIRCRMDIMIRSEIRVLEIISKRNNIDYSNEINKYKKLL